MNPFGQISHAQTSSDTGRTVPSAGYSLRSLSTSVPTSLGALERYLPTVVCAHHGFFNRAHDIGFIREIES